jgi:hypothetical protein
MSLHSKYSNGRLIKLMKEVYFLKRNDYKIRQVPNSNLNTIF